MDINAIKGDFQPSKTVGAAIIFTKSLNIFIQQSESIGQQGKPYLGESIGQQGKPYLYFDLKWGERQ